ncbi:MAG: hypothetical protein QNJ54_33605 [Prochloraceae cyanobacterium]|nr:hypothetical protein [Prochloraceae cyanobacterium]
MTNSNGNSRTLTAVRPDIFQIFLLDEDGQNILSIDDGALRQSLRIEIVNTSGRNIEFTELQIIENLENYHFSISFRPGTLLLNPNGDTNITLKQAGEGWGIQYQNNTFYIISSQPRTIESGKTITLTLENIGAAPEGGSRGTRAEIKYNNLQYQGSNEVISGNRLQYLNIVNQRGKKQIPLYIGFLGSNTILNDGTENELTLTIQSLPNQNSQLIILEKPEIQIINDTTRWQGDLVKFIQEKIPNFNSEIEKIEQNPNISNPAKQFFARLKESVNSNDSFEDFQAKLTNLTLDNTDKEIIFRILIANLGVIIEDDLNVILTQLKGLLYPQEPTSEELARIRQIILEIIQGSEKFKVIKSQLNPNGLLEFKGLDEENILDRAAKFTISFDVTTTDDNDSKNWALVEKTDADDIQIDIVRGQENWIFGGKEEQGITPRWNFICKKGLQLHDRTEILRFSISNLKTQLLSGYANLYVHYENIPGYWDGYINVPIQKGPLVYREKISNNIKVGCVGIGTDQPQAKLHVKSTTSIDSLKVDGNTQISGDFSLTNGQLGIGTTNPSHQFHVLASNAVGLFESTGNHAFLKFLTNEGANNQVEIANRPGGRLALWTRGAGDAFNITRIGNVGIGTTNPGFNKLKVQGNTEITNDLRVNATTKTEILRVDGGVSSHINADGAIYRKGGQVYITVDDNLFIRDSGGTGDNVKMHFNTNNGNLRVSTLSIGNTVIDQRDLQILKALRSGSLEVDLYNVRQGEYLYAANFAPYDNDRRRVFTWRRKNRVGQGRWRLTFPD